MNYKVKDISLAEEGQRKIEWAEAHMPVLLHLRKKYEKEKPFNGLKIACCLHLTKETAVLARTLQAAGAEVLLCGSNPLSTQDDVVASLAKDGISVFGWRGNHDEYYWCIEEVLKNKPNITIDDGGDLVFSIHKNHPELIKDIIGGNEETTTGINRLRAMAKDGFLKYPIISVSEARTKSEFDSTWGVGQSTMDGIMRATSVLIAGKKVVVAGYGYVGVGVAKRARGLGALVTICEVEPVNALYAAMDGFNIDNMENAAKYADIFITATGCKNVVTKTHFENMKDGAILCNVGHFNLEVLVDDLEKMAVSKREMRTNNVEYNLNNGKKLYLLAEGRLVNLAAAEGSAPDVMDLSFANQFLAALRIAKEGKNMKPEVYNISADQDKEIARIKLKSMGIEIDKLTSEQEKYLTGYEEGT